jgi:hypothetical protein
MMHDGMMWGMGFGGLLALVIALLVIAALIRGRPRPQASPIAAGGTAKTAVRCRHCVTYSDNAMACIEGIQLTIFVELAHKLVINEVRHRNVQHARIMDRYHCLHLCQRRQ